MTVDNFLRLLNASLRVGFFGLMCIGLLIATVLLFLDLIQADHWVTVCSVLFSADRIGNAIGSKM